MNSLFHLARHLGDISAPGFQRLYFHRQLELLDHDTSILFNRRPAPTGPDDNEASTETPVVAHRAGTNCLAMDQTQGRYLVSGGADTVIRLWDLETWQSDSSKKPNNQSANTRTHHAVTSISKATPLSHSHSITSLSIYPHDANPQTLLTTSYDQCLLLTSITPTSLVPLHSFPLDFTVYTHSVSPHPSQPLVAVGTSNPSPRLIDLRTALATHSLPGHNGPIYSLAWHPHPNHSHTLISSSTDGRILAFDIRRATPAFASFNLDDSLGITHPTNLNRRHLDFSHRAHEAPITGILFDSTGDKLISAAQDQRIRIWDVATGKSDLVHFGPRIRNQDGREGESKPVLVPSGMAGGTGARAGREVLCWPNDDGRGEVFVCEVREGTLRRVLRTKGEKAKATVGDGVVVASGRDHRGQNVGHGSTRGNPSRGRNIQSLSLATRATPKNSTRINALAFRPILSDEGLGGSLEMYSAHGDGRICAWNTNAMSTGFDNEEGDADGRNGENEGIDDEETKRTEEEIRAEKSRKRKRELIEGLVEGLTRRPVTFS